MEGDVVIEINFNMAEEKAIVKTNAKKEALPEILGAWIESRKEQKDDTSEPDRKGSFVIIIKLNLETDTFTTESDTRNKSLTYGIVLFDVFNKLDEVEILPLIDKNRR